MVAIALIVLIAGTLAQHLGLSEAVASVVAKVAKCPKCLVFWASLAALTAYQCDAVMAIGLSLINAYLSNWVGLLLMWLNRKYNTIWDRLNK